MSFTFFSFPFRWLYQIKKGTRTYVSQTVRRPAETVVTQLFLKKPGEGIQEQEWEKTHYRFQDWI
jgi:hypothetical protein